MSQQRPQGALTMVLLPSGERGAECLAVARSWASEGLLKRALWIPAEGVQPSPYGGSQARGMLLDQGQESTLDAFAVLARSRLRTLTLVVLQVCEPGTLDEAQYAAGELLLRAVKKARPEALVPAEGEDPVEVFLVNLITGPTGLAGVPYEKVSSRWFHANLVASPEDRRAADQMDRFVRPGENLVNWAMAQCATVGGLWSGMLMGPWELMRKRIEDSSLSQSDFIQPVRGFARIVTSAPTARRALATAMNDLRFTPENSLMVDHLGFAGEPLPHLDRALAAFNLVDGGRIQYATPAATPVPGPTQSGWLGAVGDFLKFSGREIAHVPVYVFRRTKAKLAKRTTDTLSGEDGHMVVYVDGQSPDLDEFMLKFERQSIESQRELAQFAGGVPSSAPELWRTLRATTFGLLDGSPIPEPIPTPIVANQRVVMPATDLVVPRPQSWVPDSDTMEALTAEVGLADMVVRPVAPWQAEYVNEVIEQARVRQSEQLARLTAEREAAVQVHREYVAALAEQMKQRAAPSDWAKDTTWSTQFTAADFTEGAGVPEPSAPDALEAWPPSEDSDSDPAVAGKVNESTLESTADVSMANPETTEYTSGDDVEPGEVEAPDFVDIAALDEQISEHQRRLEALRSDQASLQEWTAERENSLLWRLTSVLRARTLQASADVAHFREVAVSIPDIDHEEPRRARNKFANGILLMISIGLLLAWLVARFGDRVAEFFNVPTWVPWAIYCVVMFVWLMILLVRYYRRRSRFLKTWRTLSHQQTDAVRQCREAAYAEQRLWGLYEQMVEWGEILSYAVHDPWKPDDAWLSGLPDADLAASLPTCVDLAVPDPSDAKGFARLKREAMSALAGEGWRSSAFNVLLERMLADQDLRDDEDQAARLDMDSPANPNGWRRKMLEQLRSEHLQEAAAERTLRTKAARLYTNQVALASHAVTPINSEYAAENIDLLNTGNDLLLMRPGWGEFLAGALSGKTQFSQHLWSDEGSTQQAQRQEMYTLVFAPPRMRDDLPDASIEVVETLSADVNRGVELSARCDFGPPMETKQVRIFTRSSGRTAFEGASARAFQTELGGEKPAGSEVSGEAPVGNPVPGAPPVEAPRPRVRPEDVDVSAFN